MPAAQSAVSVIWGPEARLDKVYDSLDDELAALLCGDDDEEEEESLSQGSELDHALSKVGNTVDCLLRLSAAIRNPAPHDFFKSRVAEESADLIKAYQPLDKDHIRHKFVQIDESLVDRLARSMGMRRQYFKYREDHANRITRGLEEVEQGLEYDADASEDTATKTVISSIPGHLKDSKAVFESAATEPSTTAYADEFINFDDVRSQTSYASTEPDSGELRVPRRPAEYVDGPFKCPFCHMIITIQTRHEWKYNPLFLMLVGLEVMQPRKETSFGLTETFQKTRLSRPAAVYMP